MNISMIGLDTAKSVFQVHAVNPSGKVAMKRKLQRGELIRSLKSTRPAQSFWRPGIAWALMTRKEVYHAKGRAAAAAALRSRAGCRRRAQAPTVPAGSAE